MAKRFEQGMTDGNIKITKVTDTYVWGENTDTKEKYKSRILHGKNQAESDVTFMGNKPIGAKYMHKG